MTGWDWVVLVGQMALLMAAVFYPGTTTGLAAACIVWTYEPPDKHYASVGLIIVTLVVSFTWHKYVHHRFGRMRVLAWLYHHPPVVAIAAAAAAIVTGPDWVSLTGYLALVAVALWLALRHTTRPAVEIIQPQPALEHQPRVVLTRTTTVVETAAIEQSSPIDRLPYIE